MKVEDFLSLRWEDDGRALLAPRGLSPLVADPSFLFPEETPDRTWRLFAHTAFGIHAYSSPDGLAWTDHGLVVRNAMRAFVRRFDDGWRLYGERYRPFAIPLLLLPRRPRWRSRIEVRVSRDLARWETPRTVIAPTLSWHGEAALGCSVGNPCVVRSGQGWALYYSASLVHVPDCGFEEPRYIGRALGHSPDGPFTPDPRPCIDPAADPLPGVMGAGSIKVLPMEDGLVALQNRIHADASGRSRSALFILRSADGIRWADALPGPLLAPSGGWRRSHVYACDVRLRPADGRWYLYYNARDGWRATEGKERIGRLTAG